MKIFFGSIFLLISVISVIGAIWLAFSNMTIVSLIESIFYGDPLTSLCIAFLICLGVALICGLLAAILLHNLTNYSSSSYNYEDSSYSDETLYTDSSVEDNYVEEIIESLPSSIKEEELININSSILEILKKIELDLDVPIDYETDLDLSSIFSLYKLSFKEDYNSNIKKLITFIKANLEIKKVYLVITLNTLPLFNENEQNLLKKELELMGVSLVNINLCVRNKTLSVEYITIDNDLCQF